MHQSLEGFQFSFVLSPGQFIPIGVSPSWRLFTVRRNGEELLKVENPGGIPGLLGVVVAPIQIAVTNLYEAVRGAASDDLDNAIQVIDKI